MWIKLIYLLFVAPPVSRSHRPITIADDGEKETSPERWPSEVEGEIGGVLGQLTEFKGELLKLHSVVSNERERERIICKLCI